MPVTEVETSLFITVLICFSQSWSAVFATFLCCRHRRVPHLPGYMRAGQVCQHTRRFRMRVLWRIWERLHDDEKLHGWVRAVHSALRFQLHAAAVATSELCQPIKACRREGGSYNHRTDLLHKGSKIIALYCILDLQVGYIYCLISPSIIIFMCSYMS